MQQAYNYIDPKVLHPNGYPMSEAANSQISTAFDEIAVTTGQASFEEEEEEHEGTKIKQLGGPDVQGLGTYGSGYNGSFDLSSPQTQSPMATVWGKEGSHSSAMFGGPLSWTNDAEPWNPLAQTFASSVSEHDQSSRSHQGYQVEARPQWSPDLVAPRIPQMFPNGNNQYDRNFAMAGEIQYDLHSAQSIQSPEPASRLEDAMIHTAQTPSLQHPGRGNARRRQQNYTASSATSTVQYPSLETDERSLYSTFSQEVPSRSRGNPSVEGQPQLTWSTSNPLEEMDSGMPRHRIGESKSLQQYDNPNFLSPHRQNWQQYETLNSVGNQFQTTGASGYGTSDLERPPSAQSIQDTLQCESVYDDPTEYTYQPGMYQLDHPKAILIPASSKRYQPHQPSSFPVTQGFYPTDIPSSLIGPPTHPVEHHRPRGNTISTPFPSSHPMRRNTSGSKSARRSRTNSLSIIREDGQKPLALSSSPGSQKGRRYKPLGLEAREGARQKRSEKSVCVRCKMMKQTCKGGIPCDGCRENVRAKSWCQQCVRADFTSMIKAGTFNHIFQHRASHLTLSEDRRVTLHYSGTFDVALLLRRLQSCHEKYNIRVRHWSGSTYILDLAKSLQVLSNSDKISKSGICELDDFVQDKLTDEWLACITDHQPIDSTTDRLSQLVNLNNTPSRNTYLVLSLTSNLPARALDVSNANDREFILFAIQLSRIVLRALELQLFQSLQKEVNELPKSTKSDADIATLLRQLGALLISLRWRMSWWVASGDCTTHPDHSTVEPFLDRATSLAHILYCYYFVVKKKSWSESSNTQRTVLSVHPDANPVEENLPEDDTLEGFRKWLSHGHDLIRGSSVQQHLATYD